VSRLSLESNDMGMLRARALVCMLRYNCTLTWLKLGSNNFGDEGAIAIAEGLIEKVSIVIGTGLEILE